MSGIQQNLVRYLLLPQYLLHCTAYCKFECQLPCLFKARVVLLLVADKKEMVVVDLNMYSFVMPDVPFQPNELVFTTIKFNLIS